MQTSPFPLLRSRARTALVFAILATSAALADAETSDAINRTLDIAPGGRLVVDVDTGRIDVRGAADSPVVIAITRAVRAGSTAAEEHILREHVITIDQSGDTVTIRARGSSGSTTSWWRSLFSGTRTRRDYVFQITVPERFAAELKTSGGGIRVASLTGEVRTRTSGGGLEFDRLTGPIDGRTSGGGITLTSCNGEVSVHTSGGGIRSTEGEGTLKLATSGGGITVRGHRGNVDAGTSGGGITLENIAGNVEAHTSGGAIRATLTTAPTGECRLGTSGGGVAVALVENAALTLDASTSGGSVRSELPVTVVGEHKGNRLKGAINGGGPLLHLRSSGGSIRLTKLAPTSAGVER